MTIPLFDLLLKYFHILSQKTAKIDFEEEKGQQQMRIKINGKEMVAIKK